MDLGKLKDYELISNREITDINAKGYILRHKVTGAKVVCLLNDDPNKVFYIGFRTPPTDSTGVPHIIEHSVLCGSTKYPAKDPFVELAKGSLNTFLNAMTYPDKTVYPIASCNDQDFQNLMDVYLDAVFHPNIYSREQIFKQEGWHYELEDENEEITLNGVVYSEMKGAFSSPDDVLERAIIDSLFPDTCYGVESGGDPDVIPNLTYEAFLDFHSKYYHPSNSYIYLYGDMDLEEKLQYIHDDYLSKYEYLEIDSSIGEQKTFDSTKRIIKEYSITNDEALTDNTYLSYNAVVGTSLDRKLYLAFQVIEYALLGNPGAVLKKALLDKGICKDVQSTYENGIFQPYFSVIAKNSNESCLDEFTNTIKEVLEGVVKNGFDKKSLYAGINVFEFKYREADFGHYPKGLMYGLQILDSWLYDDSKPFIHIEALETFEFLKNQVENGYFEKLVDEYLLHNSHESIVVMTPKRGLTAIKDKELADKLSKYKESLSSDEIKKLCKDTKMLHDYQQEEDSKEILEKIPLLKISDIKKEAADFVFTENIRGNNTFVTHDIFTNGIGYLTVLFDISQMDEELLPYVGILKNLIGYVDTKNYDYADLANEIFLNSGGIYATSSVSVDAIDSDKYLHLFELKAKVLYEKIDFAYDMIKELALYSDFTDKKRLYEIICMIKSRLQMNMQSQGHLVSARRAMANIKAADAIVEKASGIDFYRVIEEIEADFDNRATDVIDKLKLTARLIFNRKNLICQDYIAVSEEYNRFYEYGEKFADSLPNDDIELKGMSFEPSKVNEGYKTGAKVQYVSKAGIYLDEKHPYTGALKVLKVIMGYDYLWNQVRVVGGAYGAFATFYRAGEGVFSSYRDPNLSRTLDIYNETIDYLKSFDVDERTMTKYIIGTVADLDTPLTPSAQGSRGLDAYLSHDSYELIQKERDEILNATSKDISMLYEYIENMKASESICVLGGEEMIEDNKELFNKIEPLFK